MHSNPECPCIKIIINMSLITCTTGKSFTYRMNYIYSAMFYMSLRLSTRRKSKMYKNYNDILNIFLHIRFFSILFLFIVNIITWSIQKFYFLLHIFNKVLIIFKQFTHYIQNLKSSNIHIFYSNTINQDIVF